jgi:hypothetical protein
MEELQRQLAELQAKNAQLAKEVEESKKVRALKGDKVRWTLPNGKVVEGHAQKYYYLKMDSKPYMKEVSKATVLERNIFDINKDEFQEEESK